MGACPVFSILALLFGFRALLEIRTNPLARGKNLARAAIFLASLITTFWIISGFWWHINVRRPLMKGPAVILESDANSRMDIFFSYFGIKEPSSNEVLEAESFFQDVEERWGKFLDGTVKLNLDETVEESNKPLIFGLMPYSIEIDYLLTFEKGLVPAHARYRVANSKIEGLDDFLLFFDLITVGVEDPILFRRRADY